MSNLLKEALQPERLMIDDNGLIAAIKQETKEKEELSYDGIIRKILTNNAHTPWTVEQCEELTDTYTNLPPIIVSYLGEIGTTTFHIEGMTDAVTLFCPVAMKDVMSAQEQLATLVGVEMIGTAILYLTNGLFIDLCGSIVGKHAIFAIDTKTGPYVVFDDFQSMLQWFVNAADEVVDYTQESEEGNEATSDLAEDPAAEEAGDTATDNVESVTEPSEPVEGDTTDTVEGSEPQGSTNQSLIQQMLINKYTWKDVQAEYDTLADFLNALLQDATLSQENCVGCGTTTTVSTTVKNISNGTNVVQQGGNRDGAEYQKHGEGDGQIPARTALSRDRTRHDGLQDAIKRHTRQPSLRDGLQRTHHANRGNAQGQVPTDDSPPQTYGSQRQEQRLPRQGLLCDG